MKKNAPIPGQFPIRIEDALECWLPSVKPLDRWPIFRRYLAYCQAVNAQILQLFGGPAKPGFDITQEDKVLGEEHFRVVGAALLEWRQKEISLARSESGRKGGRPKGKQGKEKKPLTE